MFSHQHWSSFPLLNPHPVPYQAFRTLNMMNFPSFSLGFWQRKDLIAALSSFRPSHTFHVWISMHFHTFISGPQVSLRFSFLLGRLISIHFKYKLLEWNPQYSAHFKHLTVFFSVISGPSLCSYLVSACLWLLPLTICSPFHPDKGVNQQTGY